MRTSTAVFCLFVALCVTLAHAKVYPVYFQANSVRSHIFEPLRPKGAPQLNKECGSVVTAPYGLLEQEYKRGEVVQGTTCTWKLRAPANHRINVINVAFDLLDPTSDELSEYDASKTSAISLYDSYEPGKNIMRTFYTTPREKAAAYVSSISTNETMAVEIKYSDNVDFATQKIRINYEFLDADKMMELLRAYN